MASSSVLAELDDEDRRTVTRLRRDLAGWRVISGMSQRQVGAVLGVSDDMVSKIETGKHGAMRLADIAKLARVYGLVVNVRFEGLEDDWDAAVTKEVETLAALSDANPYSGAWLSALIVASLRAMRKHKKVGLPTIAAHLGIAANSLSVWELDSDNPHLYRMMAYTRVLGGRLRVALLEVDPVWPVE